MTARRIAVFVAGGIAVIVGVSSTAWACFVAGTAPYVSVEPHSAPAGARVKVTGGNWVAGADTDAVSLRWGSASGTVIGSGQPNPDSRGAFSVVVTIPDEEAGPHLVYAVQAGSETQAVAVEITAAATGTDPGDPQPATQPTRTALSTNSGATRAPAAAPAAAAAPTGAAAGVSAPAAAETASPSLPSAPALEAARTRSTAASAAVARVPARQGTALRSLLPAAPAAAAGVAQEQPAAAPAPVPSARSASGDVWSGLASGLDRAPSLSTLPGTSGSSGPSEALIGLGVLMAGLVALSGGFAAGELRRRKALVGSSGTTR